MIKSKRKAKAFINYLYSSFDVPRIPIYIHWYHPSVITGDNGVCFGCFCYEDGPNEIHVAGSKIKTSGALSTIAHEFVHYLQYVHGRDMKDDVQIEADAEYFGACLYGLWLLREKCDWVKAWEEHTDRTKEEIENVRP